MSSEGANAFYGLHALNNLDIAVNGKDVNAMPSYQEVRKRNVRSSANNNLDSSGGSAEYSPPQPRDGWMLLSDVVIFKTVQWCEISRSRRSL